MAEAGLHRWTFRGTHRHSPGPGLCRSGWTPTPGFLLDFISCPVIKGFTSAASITIGFGQIKNLLGLQKIPRQFFLQVYHTFLHIGETRVGDAVLGLASMLLLLVLKCMREHMPPPHPEMPLAVKFSRGLVWTVTTARNALVVSSAALIAYAFEVTGSHPFVLTGKIAEGLPPVRIPPFSVTRDNKTISFSEMVQDMGAGLAVVPLMGLLESIAVAKSFASQNNYRIDANQELLAIGLTNVLGSLVSSYPVTGSFGRTAVNAQTGVCTPAGGLVTGEPHPHSFFTLGAYGGNGGGGEPIVLQPCTAFLPSLCRSITVQWITRLPHT